MVEAIRKCSTNAEWKGWRGLRMVAAAGYLVRDRAADIDEWCRAVMADEGCLSGKDDVRTAVGDTRTRTWVGIPLEGFVGKLADLRKELKAAGDEPGQVAVKLTINALYGVFCSRHFRVGNAILGNNITARARLGVWMLAKSLGLVQTITDGGLYDPAAVPAFRGKRPGISTLASMWDWRDTRHGRTTMPLGGIDDAIAARHVDEFWRPYGLPFPFPRIEHKVKNCGHAAAYWAKGDYAIDSQPRSYAVRGKLRKTREEDRRHPTFDLLDNILDGRDEFPSRLNYIRSGLMKVGMWRCIQLSSGYDGMRHLRPGDRYGQPLLARYNNGHFPIGTRDDYKRRRDRKKCERGWFERFGSISKANRRMAQDRLR